MRQTAKIGEWVSAPVRGVAVRDRGAGVVPTVYFISDIPDFCHRSTANLQQCPKG